MSYRFVDVTENAREQLQTVANRNLVPQIEKILNEIREVLQSRNAVDLPPLRIFKLKENDSILMEWILPHCRISFNFEGEESQSGWSLVSDTSSGIGQRLEWGYLPDVDIGMLVNQAIRCTILKAIYPD